MPTLTKRDIVHEALKGIGVGIKNLTEMHSPINATNSPGSPGQFYPPGGYMPAEYGNFGNGREHGNLHPTQWPPVVETTEAMIGAALVVAQEYIGKPNTDRHGQICHLANYWKHREEWGDQWQTAHPKTRAGIEALGATVPADRVARLGQLTTLIEVVLGVPFSTLALWEAISDITP